MTGPILIIGKPLKTHDQHKLSKKHAKLFKNLRLHYCVIETESIEKKLKVFEKFFLIFEEKLNFVPKLKIGFAFGRYIAEGIRYKFMWFCPNNYKCIYKYIIN